MSCGDLGLNAISVLCFHRIFELPRFIRAPKISIESVPFEVMGDSHQGSIEVASESGVIRVSIVRTRLGVFDLVVERVPGRLEPPPFLFLFTFAQDRQLRVLGGAEVE